MVSPLLILLQIVAKEEHYDCDVQGASHDQSCQDAMGQHKMMKQVSTSSIQVGEGMYNIKDFNRLLQQFFVENYES